MENFARKFINKVLEPYKDEYNQIMGPYNQTLEDIKNYNRADTVNMNENEMNKFRHIAGPAWLSSNEYGEGLTRGLGYAKEFKDLRQGRGIPDTWQDILNNEKGLEYGRRKWKDKKTLFDYVYKTDIEPYR